MATIILSWRVITATFGRSVMMAARFYSSRLTTDNIGQWEGLAIFIMAWLLMLKMWCYWYREMESFSETHHTIVQASPPRPAFSLWIHQGGGWRQLMVFPIYTKRQEIRL